MLKFLYLCHLCVAKNQINNNQKLIFMKKLYLFLVIIVFSLPLFSQTFLIQEGFESLPFSFTTTNVTGNDDWTQNATYFAEGTKSIRGAVPANTGQNTQLTTIVFSKIGRASCRERV